MTQANWKEKQRRKREKDMARNTQTYLVTATLPA